MRKQYLRPIKSTTNRRHKKYGQTLAKSIASKDITEYVNELNSFYSMNYLCYEGRIFSCLKNNIPKIISINTNML